MAKLVIGLTRIRLCVVEIVYPVMRLERSIKSGRKNIYKPLICKAGIATIIVAMKIA
jgi:hypothetical protein